ncbi:hypothetical protein [Streptomyces sp. CA2R106]|uniref:hypothetical protein n=1 Tax=Streptomyces sp. CA2R106 TaxID=3120153 RepID=UPI00300818D5
MVKTPLRIGITGAHFTGKTQLLRRIERELRAAGLSVARTGHLGTRAAGLGLPKMSRHTTASTEWIMAQGIADEIAAAAQGAEVVLADRAVIDALAYYYAALDLRAEPAAPAEDERLRLLAGTQHAKYQLLLATVLDRTAPVDTDDAYGRYRVLVDRHVHALLAEERLAHLRVGYDEEDQARAVQLAVDFVITAAST